MKTMDFFFHNRLRMDWGIGNPNKTAALIATLMISIWILNKIHRWGFWVALSAFLGLGLCLVHTYSRGGFVALSFGITVLIYFSPTPWSRARMLSILAVAATLIAAIFYLHENERLEQGILQNDKSISNRLLVWEIAPVMIADAPNGWGWGNAGKAYMQWFQPLSHHEGYRTLVNSHLTWLVEGNWFFRIGYIAGWLFVFLLCLPSGQIRTCIPLSVWATFFVTAWFSSVAESAIVWLIPGISLIGLMILRWKVRQWPPFPHFLSAFASAALLSLILLVIGKSIHQPYFLLREQNLTIVGDTPSSVLVEVNEEVMGEYYGRTLRTFISSYPQQQVILASSPDALQQRKIQSIVLGGDISSANLLKIQKYFVSSSRLIVLSPKFFPSDIGITKVDKGRIKVFFGEFSASPSIDEWKKFATVRQIEGSGDYLQDWPELSMPRPDRTQQKVSF